MIDSPDRRLRAVADPDFAQDRFDVHLDSGFRDIELSADLLVGFAVDEALEDIDFS